MVEEIKREQDIDELGNHILVLHLDPQTDVPKLTEDLRHLLDEIFHIG